MSTNEFLCACATDEGTVLVDRHFGEAGRYDLYRVGKEKIAYVKTIENITPEEKQHGDPNKAKNVGNLMGSEGVQVLVSGQFGRNLKRIKKRFVPIIMRVFEIERALETIQAHFDRVEEEYQRDEEREHIVIR